MNETPRHSVALPTGETGDHRLFAPAAARNIGPIIDGLRQFVPETGFALEIASGTGEHVVAFSTAFPRLRWQPTDVDPARLASIEAWTHYAKADQVLPPVAFDAAQEQWLGPKTDVVFLSNLLHLVSAADARSIVDCMAAALAPGGVLAIYGPFLRESGYASAGDERFDAAIRAENHDAGYKSITSTEDHLLALGLTRCDCLSMPANNLMSVWKRPR
ncbi:MAG: DUF938 domain-containing protein [Pseudomonadota bacterium]